MSRQGTDVAIIGGGVIGCAIAYRLAKAGVRSVVLERGETGREASGAAAGMLAPLSEAHGPGPFFDLMMASLQLFPAVLDDLRQLAPKIDVQHQRLGVLRIAMNEEQLGQLRQRYAWQQSSGGKSEWLRPEELRGLEPELSPKVIAGILSPGEQQLDPLRLTQAFAKAAQSLGAEVHTDSPVLGFEHKGGRVTGARTQQGVLSAGHVVIAAGSWSGQVAERLGVRLPMRPIRGQILELGGLGITLRHIIWGEGYLTPKPGGVVQAGTTVEEAGFRSHTTLAGLRKIRAAANRMIPALRQARTVRSWAGLRPASADGLPALGPLPAWDNVIIAAGHFRNGILLAPITGHLMTELIIQGKTEMDISPYRPGRFA